VRGSLTVVGTGIQLACHLTPEARAHLLAADEVLYLVGDLVAVSSLQRLNANTRSLHELYEPGRSRDETYDDIVAEILSAVRGGARVCVALYGHPGVFARPAHQAVQRARAEGYPARMLPAVSAEDCLFADLGVDPGENGCQSYEATDFLLRKREVDVSAALVLWQISVVGNLTYAPDGDPSRLPVLVEYLCRFYPREHEVVLYEAAQFPGSEPIIQRLALADLAEADVSPATTLYVPPTGRRAVDRELRERLGLADASPARTAAPAVSPLSS